MWKCIRDMQHGRRGLVPARLATVVDEEGNACTTVEAQQQRWRRHFTKILNIQSQFNEVLVDLMVTVELLAASVQHDTTHRKLTLLHQESQTETHTTSPD